MNYFHLFSVFHLNLAFSSIEEEARPEVIARCYWPLLRLIRDQRVPVGIEASGYTLEEIQRIDPAWVDELRDLCVSGIAEFIGSGYAQIIGPLVPAEVNRANQRIGLQVYESILGFCPEIVLVSEQAYSAGLVSIYHEAGYRALIMEWDNPGQSRERWNPEWRYLPQYACGSDGTVLPVIWNKSIPFQKFQRYAHSEIELDEYLKFLHSSSGLQQRIFPLYGNDAEIFNFRPGRFNTEPSLGDQNEWERIGKLYAALARDEHLNLILPSQVLGFLTEPHAGGHLRLETASQPIPVKKQRKYNISRWALSGRDDLDVNNKCWYLFRLLQASRDSNIEDWKELCYLWSSDFRTHITDKRWGKYQKRLSAMHSRWELPHSAMKKSATKAEVSSDLFIIQDQQHYLSIKTSLHAVRLNKRRGLTIDRWYCHRFSDDFMLGTLPHGYFDDIAYGADYYSGLTVLEIPGQHKVTDLTPVNVTYTQTWNGLEVSAVIDTPLGSLEKVLVISAHEEKILHKYRFKWPVCPAGSLRLGTLTLNPTAFDRGSLFYRTHNGGNVAETFILDTPVNHGAPVSALVSSTQGLGLTCGRIEFGDQNYSVHVKVGDGCAGILGQVFFQPVDKHYLFRIGFSAMEMDDTSLKNIQRKTFAEREISFEWRLGSTGQIAN